MQTSCRKYQFLLIVLSFAFVDTCGQTYSDKEKTLRKVFIKIVEAYSNPKAAPELKLLPKTGKESVIARYFSDSGHIIKVDEKLVDICLDLKSDSLNALSIILSHELAHYYYGHALCIDFAFAQPNTSLSKKIFIDYQANKFTNEAEADLLGIWYAAIAGYYPFDIFKKMINKIYAGYGLNNKLKGYPTKTQRIEINNRNRVTANTLLPVFDAGNILIQIGRYEEAAVCFDNVVRTFPSRENYNNAGAAKLLAALKLKKRGI